jgi:hypothetical protein
MRSTLRTELSNGFKFISAPTSNHLFFSYRDSSRRILWTQLLLGNLYDIKISRVHRGEDLWIMWKDGQDCTSVFMPAGDFYEALSIIMEDTGRLLLHEECEEDVGLGERLTAVSGWDLTKLIEEGGPDGEQSK